MTSDSKSIAGIRDIVSVIRTGGGILGKSAMLIALLLICVGIAVVRIPPADIIHVLEAGAVIFFAWFVPILWLVNKYPEKAFLEGPQWSAHHQRELLAAKGQPLIPADSSQISEAGIVQSNPEQHEGFKRS